MPSYLEKKVLHALRESHPYEEVAYYFQKLENENQEIGAGMVAELEESMDEMAFLKMLKEKMNLGTIKHTSLLGKKIRKVAVCGGAGIFLLPDAKKSGADIFITSDIKYHEFFDAENRLLLADIGHWESEQFTIDLLAEHLSGKFPTFAVLKTGVKTNPVEYFK